MSDLVGNPEDRFSQNEAHIIIFFQVRQYIHSVNGHYVLRDDHKSVGKLIMQSHSHVTLTVMIHTRDAGF